MVLARTIVGIRYRLEGQENIPEGGCIIAAQHQSSFETYLLTIALERPVFVLKRELVFIPVIGWYMARARHCQHRPRRRRGAAMRKTLRAAKAALARRPIMW